MFNLSFSKCHRNPTFGFDFFDVRRRFGFAKTDSEPTFGFPHIPSYLVIKINYNFDALSSIKNKS